MHLSAGQAPNRTLCFLCTSSSTDSVLLLQPALPPQLPRTKQVMLMLVLSCWQGQQGYNLSPRIPDEPADEWHIIANAPTVVLSGKWDESRPSVRLCSVSPSFWTPVFLTMWVDSKKELRSFYSGRPPLLCLYSSFILWKRNQVRYVYPNREGVLFFFPRSDNYQAHKWSEIEANAFSNRTLPWLLRRRMCFCEAESMCLLI